MTMRSVVALGPDVTLDDRKLLDLFDNYRPALVKHRAALVAMSVW